MLSCEAIKMRFTSILLLFVFISIPVVHTFLSPLHSSYELAQKLSIKGNIDNSHNHEHSKEVLYWSIEIMERLPYTLSALEVSMVGHCSLLHDFMDAKYVDFSKEIRAHLLSFYENKYVDVMMNIMGTMSYSKIVSHDGEVCFPDWISMSAFATVFHIIREADLLSSYNIARMVEYRLYNKNYYISFEPNCSMEHSIIKEIEKLYFNRMDKLVERKLFVHKSSHELATAIATVSKIKLSLLNSVDLHKNLDILRIVNYLSIDDLIERIDWIN